MRWISSLGGPLILLPTDAVPRWTGAYGPDGQDDWDEEDTEYWRVSEEVTDYAAVVGVAGVDALVLANGKSPTCFVEPQQLFVQQLAKGPDIDVVANTVGALPTVGWQHTVEWRCPGPGLLFDCAQFGPDLDPATAMAVHLAPGRYLVRCGYRDPDATVGSFVALTLLTPLP